MTTWLVMRERDATGPNGAVHLWTFEREGQARQRASESAREYPGIRYIVALVVGACEASITPALWDEPPTTNASREAGHE